MNKLEEMTGVDLDDDGAVGKKKILPRGLSKQARGRLLMPQGVKKFLATGKRRLDASEASRAAKLRVQQEMHNLDFDPKDTPPRHSAFFLENKPPKQGRLWAGRAGLAVRLAAVAAINAATAEEGDEAADPASDPREQNELNRARALERKQTK